MVQQYALVAVELYRAHAEFAIEPSATWIVAVETGFLTSPSALHPFAIDSRDELMAAVALVLISTFLVPLSVLVRSSMPATSLKVSHGARAVRPL